MPMAAYLVKGEAGKVATAGATILEFRLIVEAPFGHRGSRHLSLPRTTNLSSSS